MTDRTAARATSAVVRAALVVSALVCATRAHASGSYGADYFDRAFVYRYEELTRTWFRTSEDAEAYYGSYERAVQRDFLAFAPRVAAVLDAATREGVAIAPFDLFAPRLPLAHLAGATRFPVNVELELPAHEGAREAIVVTATAKWSPERVARLQAALTQALAGRSAGPYVSLTDVEEKRVEDARFEDIVAVTHFEGTFAVYVGVTTYVREEDRAYVRAHLEQRFQRVLPRMRAHFAQPDVAAQLKLPGSLGQVAPIAQLWELGLTASFMPYGPLDTGSLIRMTVEDGEVTTMVMIAPPKGYVWKDTYPVMRAWLTEASAPPVP